MRGSEACVGRAEQRAAQGPGGEASKEERMALLQPRAVGVGADGAGAGTVTGGAREDGRLAPGRYQTRIGGVQPATASPSHEELLRVRLTRQRMLLFGVFVLAALAFLYFVLPQLGGVKHTWDRLNDGDAWWIAVAVGVEVVSMASYVAIFQGVHVPPGSPIRWRHSYQITMAGLAATRLFAAGGAGGVAVTAWSLRRSGMDGREVAQRMIAFLMLMYGVYMTALVVCGVGLYTGVFPGPHPFAITIVPAIVGAVGLAAIVGIAFVPEDLEQRLARTARRRRSSTGQRAVRWLGRFASAPAAASGGARFALQKLRRPEWALLGVVGWWGFNVAVLYATFRAFGDAPPVAVLVQAYFVGMLANLLPLPGGIGGVDGGMIGALVAFGVGSSLALIAVLVYRLLAFWLPSIPGVIAYFQLRRTVSRWEQRGGAPAGAGARAPVAT
jgi:putative heme transporter